MRFRYTTEHLAFLSDGYKFMTGRQLTEAFNFAFGLQMSHTAIKSALKNHKITSGRKAGYPVGYRRMFTKEQEEFIRWAYRQMTLTKVTKALNDRFDGNWTVQQLKTYCNNHKIHSGRDGCFQKGLAPWNKGTHFCAGGRSAETRFQPGQMPVTTLPVGAEVVDHDGYRKVKVSEGGKPGESRFNWKYVHVLEWEKHHGPVPDGHAVCFRDGDKSNCDIDNLVLLTRAELCYLNKSGLQMAELPPELRRTARLLARVKTRTAAHDRKTRQ